MIFYLIKVEEFKSTAYMLRITPPQDDTPETLVAELDVATIEGQETDVSTILGTMYSGGALT